MKNVLKSQKKIEQKTGKTFGLVYARVSSKKQETEGSGLQSQEGRCVAQLANLGVEYDRTFPDTYSGGGDFMKRPAMRELLNYIDSNPHKKFLVIFDDLKRFARDVEFHIKLRTSFRIRNVELRCLNYNFDDSPEGRFAELVMAGQAQLEREQNGRQVIQKQKARIEAGYWPFARKKGYNIVKDPSHGKIAVPNNEGLTMLKPALEAFSKGDLIRKIDVCRFLFEKGFWKTMAPEKYLDRVTKYLKDPFYAGYVEYQAWETGRIKGKHQPLINLDTFEKIQRRLKRESLGKTIRIDTSSDFPLRGLIICSECGKHLTGSWSRGRSKKYPHYWCCNFACTAKGKTISRKIIESKFEELLKQNKLKDGVDSLVVTIFDRVWKDELKNIENREVVILQKRSSVEGQINELTDLILETKSDMLKRTYEKRLEAMANQLEKIDNRKISETDLDLPYRTALGKAIQMLKNPYEIWGKLDVIEKQKLFFFVFEGKLSFSRTDGFRTDEKSYAVRLFEELVSKDTYLVDHVGLEPTTSYMPCKRSSQLS